LAEFAHLRQLSDGLVRLGVCREATSSTRNLGVDSLPTIMVFDRVKFEQPLHGVSQQRTLTRIFSYGAVAALILLRTRRTTGRPLSA
jgi:hypothetical protein